mgnify:FL=1|jgi:hypothetical protein|tara:strand:- start:7 stop:213 length:207 start_codon:yes stop_codon:yes gene_type:complete
MNNIPTVYAVKKTVNCALNGPTDLLTFDCPKCGKTHTHGYGEGHRVSHCADRDLWKNGYYLKEKRDDV